MSVVYRAVRVCDCSLLHGALGQLTLCMHPRAGWMSGTEGNFSLLGGHVKVACRLERERERERERGGGERGNVNVRDEILSH